MIRENVGKGTLIYAGTYLGIAAAEKSGDFLRDLLEGTAAAHGIISEKQKDGIFLSPLVRNGNAMFLVAVNRSDHSAKIHLPKICLDIFNGEEGNVFELEPDSAALYVVEKEEKEFMP